MADQPTNDTPSGQQQLPLSDSTAASAAEIAALKTQIAQTGQTMEQRLAQMQQQLAAGRPPVAPTGGDDQRINEQIWHVMQTDPRQLLNAQQMMTARMIQEARQQDRLSRLDTDKTIARNAIREEFPEVFQKYGADVESKIAEIWPNNPEVFTNPQCWRIAAKTIKADKAEEFVKDRGTDPGAPGKPSAKPMPTAKGKDDETLSEAETYAAEAVFGIDPKEYGKYKKINKEQRDQKTWAGRAMLQSPLAKMYYKDMNKTVGGFPNPHFGKMRPYMTFDSQVQKPRHARDGE